MTPSSATAVAFATSGAIWLTGVALFGGEGWDASFFVPVGGYVAIGSLVLGIRSDRLVSTLFGLWAVAVLVLPLVLAGGGASASEVAAVIVFGLVYGLVFGTPAFIGWVAFGLIGLRLLGHLPDPAPAAFADDPR